MKKKGDIHLKSKMIELMNEIHEEGFNIFKESVGMLKLEYEVKRLRNEGKTIDDLSCDEFKKRFNKYTKYEIEKIREMEKQSEEWFDKTRSEAKRYFKGIMSLEDNNLIY